MAKGKITKTSVSQLEAESSDPFLWDSELRGFGVKVAKNGAKTYVFQYRMGGREASTRRRTIGVHGSPWTPMLAREEAERLALSVAQGIDPNAADLERRRLAIDLAFEPYAARFQKTCGDRGWGKMVERTLRLHLTPHFKRKPINTITRSNIAAVLDAIPQEQLALRRNTFAVLRKLFRWAAGRGDIDRSPCDGMETPKAVTPRDRVLSEVELARVWRASEHAGKLFGPIVRLLIATGQRREEVSGLDWSELDQSSKMWTLPKERAKNATAHLVPLNASAVEVLASMCGTASEWPRQGLVFKTSGGKRFIAHSKGKQQIDAVISKDELPAIPPWRLHDLRRTVATGFQRLGIRFEVTEAILNHLSGSKAGVAGTYQRHDWLPEKRDALERWANHLRGLTAGAPGDTAPQEASDLQRAFERGMQLGVELGKSLPRNM